MHVGTHSWGMMATNLRVKERSYPIVGIKWRGIAKASAFHHVNDVHSMFELKISFETLHVQMNQLKLFNTHVS